MFSIVHSEVPISYACLTTILQHLGYNTQVISQGFKPLALNYLVTGGCLRILKVMIPGILGSSK